MKFTSSLYLSILLFLCLQIPVNSQTNSLINDNYLQNKNKKIIIFTKLELKDRPLYGLDSDLLEKFKIYTAANIQDISLKDLNRKERQNIKMEIKKFHDLNGRILIFDEAGFLIQNLDAKKTSDELFKILKYFGENHYLDTPWDNYFLN